MHLTGVALVTFAYQQHAENCLRDHNGGAPAPRTRCGGCCCTRRRPAPLLKGQRIRVRRFGCARADHSRLHTWLLATSDDAVCVSPFPARMHTINRCQALLRPPCPYIT